MIFKFRNLNDTVVVVEKIESIEMASESDKEHIFVTMDSGSKLKVSYKDVDKCIEDFVKLRRQIINIFDK